jgi:hypothetical protein
MRAPTVFALQQQFYSIQFYSLRSSFFFFWPHKSINVFPQAGADLAWSFHKLDEMLRLDEVQDELERLSEVPVVFAVFINIA